MKEVTRTEILNALGIYHKISLKLIKYIKENYNGAIFYRIMFADSTKLIVEYMLDCKEEEIILVSVTLTYEELGLN